MQTEAKKPSRIMAEDESGTGFKVDKLTNDNYHHWKFNMRMFLMGKDLWEITDGTEVLPDGAGEEKRRKFKKRENQAMSFICLGVSTPLQIYVRPTKSAKEAWESLSSHFEEKTLSRKIHYRRKLYALRMEKGTTMTAHVNSLKTIAEHLESLDDAVVEKDLVMILISSLPESYNNLITALETLKEENLTWTYVRDRVISEFQRRQGGDKKSKAKNLDDHDALLSQGSGGNFHKKKGGGNHNPNQNKSTQKQFKCHHCNEKGHFIKDCPKKKATEAGKKQSASFCKNKKPEVEEDEYEPEFALFSCCVDLESSSPGEVLAEDVETVDLQGSEGEFDDQHPVDQHESSDDVSPTDGTDNEMWNVVTPSVLQPSSTDVVLLSSENSAATSCPFVSNVVLSNHVDATTAICDD